MTSHQSSGEPPSPPEGVEILEKIMSDAPSRALPVEDSAQPRTPNQFAIEWVVRAGGRKARCPPNPAYPDGIHNDITFGAPGCVAEIPYPAECLGVWIVRCRICGYAAGVTAAGRPDDPRSIKVPCHPIGKPQ